MTKPARIPFKKGLFDHDTLTVKFGGEHSKPENMFIATAVKVPDFKYKRYERADAGGGCYYDYKEWNEYEQNNAYVILRDNEVIGWMQPTHKCHGPIKDDLYPLDWKYTDKPIKDFAAKFITQPY